MDIQWLRSFCLRSALALSAMAAWGAFFLPADARIPIHWTHLRPDVWAGKASGLLLIPTVVWLIALAVRHQTAASLGGPVVRPAIATAVVAFGAVYLWALGHTLGGVHLLALAVPVTGMAAASVQGMARPLLDSA